MKLGFHGIEDWILWKVVCVILYWASFFTVLVSGLILHSITDLVQAEGKQI